MVAMRIAECGMKTETMNEERGIGVLLILVRSSEPRSRFILHSTFRFSFRPRFRIPQSAFICIPHSSALSSLA